MNYWNTGHPIQDGRYIVEQVLGSGGVGVTYLAKEKDSGRLVALKTLNAMMQIRNDFSKHQEKFVQECFRLAKCSHKHIISVYDVCQEEELWCMVMEYIPGGNLEQLVRSKGVLSQPEALQYIYQIGQALSYIHQKQILHRDIKPANIMLREDIQEAVLIDFGLAKDFVEDKIQTHTNSRTEGFAPIEQYEKQAKRGTYTDTYALAATLYYLLTLKLPIPAPFRQQGMSLIAPQYHIPNISNRVNQAILKGMEFLPADRPTSVKEWLEMLLGNRSISLSQSKIKMPPPPPPPLPKTKGKQKSKTPKLQSLSSKNQETLINRDITQLETSSFDNQSSQETYIQKSRESYKPLEYYKTTPIKSKDTNPINLYTPEHRSKIPDDLPISNNEKQRKLGKKVSAVGIDYIPLRDLLAKGEWQKADKLTTKIILTVAGREKFGYLNLDSVKHFPLDDLYTLNKLWVRYTKGHFGFSSQKILYQCCGDGSKYNKEAWENFMEIVGWKNNHQILSYQKLNFTPSAPQGHLPWWYDWAGGVPQVFISFLSPKELLQ